MDKMLKNEFLPVVALLKEIMDRHPEIKSVDVSRQISSDNTYYFAFATVNCTDHEIIYDNDLPIHCEELEGWE